MTFLVVSSLLFLNAFAFYRYFHRVPPRHTPQSANVLISPADGVVWQIIPLRGDQQIEIQKQFLGKIKTLSQDVEQAEWLVSIFMNPLDCHVNWSPVDGKVVSVKHTSGNFSFANTWKSLWNEKNEILIESSGFKIKVIQIAGFVARRIDCWIQQGQAIKRGERIGMIRLGSQVSLILPRGIKLEVEKGQKVKGGETILGRWET